MRRWSLSFNQSKASMMVIARPQAMQWPTFLVARERFWRAVRTCGESFLFEVRSKR
jgi:hypothetical protein